LVNQFTGGVRYISFQEQVIMAYGGLRGAVSFSLAFMLPDDVDGTKATLLSATYVVILFTVFCQGCSIKFLVKCLNIRLAKKEDNFRLFNAFTKGVVNHMIQGIEDIIGFKDQTLARRAGDLTRRHLRPLLQHDYIEQQTGDRLMLIESEENFKETLRSHASQASLMHQKAVEGIEDELSEQGSVTVDLYDEHYDQQMVLKQREMRKRRHKPIEETEREVEQLTRNTLQIQSLIRSLTKRSYPDRNLVNEMSRERRHSAPAVDLYLLAPGNNYERNLERIFSIRDLTETQKRSILLGLRVTEKKRMSVAKGVLAVSALPMGISAGNGRPTPTSPLANSALQNFQRNRRSERHPLVVQSNSCAIPGWTPIIKTNFRSNSKKWWMNNKNETPPPPRPSAPKPPITPRVKFMLENDVDQPKSPETIRLIDEETEY